jgi:tricorn protease
MDVPQIQTGKADREAHLGRAGRYAGLSSIDGRGYATAPNLAIWTPEEGWTVENVGVPPDIEVEQTPADVIAGHDPQLEKAIQVVMEELEKSPPPNPKRPPYPVKTLVKEQ